MPNRKVFFSFHFDNDVMRYHQIKNIGAIHGDEPVSATEWERIRRGCDSAIERWIDGQMSR
ncbi:MAG: TIR domain-containing protein, partial [Chitinophagaceae bacterium]|nr:TIR domain-containing protein [Chitinophagaceae bacterium]